MVTRSWQSQKRPSKLTVFSFSELRTGLGTVITYKMGTDKVGTTLQLDADLSTEFIELLQVLADLHHSTVAFGFVSK